MKTFKVGDGATLAYRDDGQGLPLMALAGLTRDSRDFDYLARCLREGIRLIRLDSRGRGGSEWTGPGTYTVGQEAADALALLDHLGLDRAAIVGSSRGGLLGMVIVATAKHRVLGLCLNDVGPILERDGLLRIGSYVGVEPTVPTLEEVADRMNSAMPGFERVPAMRWKEETVRHYIQNADGVGLTYDPELRTAFEAAMAGPLPELWPLFNSCVGIPLALIRGAASDVLSRATAEEMRRRRPDLLFAEIPMRGHIPFLDEPEAIALVSIWLDQVTAFAAMPLASGS